MYVHTYVDNLAILYVMCIYDIVTLLLMMYLHMYIIACATTDTSLDLQEMLETMIKARDAN